MRRRFLFACACVASLLAGCGRHYVLLHPAGPVGRIELHTMTLATIVMAIVILAVFVVFAIALVRFRDVAGRSAPYRPDWNQNRNLEILWFVIPVLMLTVIGFVTAQDTFALAKLPPAKDRVVVDVTSLSWKWLFQYPRQRIATINYAVVPAGKPIVFELTAHSAINAFWVPELGGMENTVPGRVLPLWLQADKPGVYWGHGAQFSGIGFEKMFFRVEAVPPARFTRWAAQVRATARPMTMTDYRQLLRFGTMGEQTYAGYPAGTFPTVAAGFSIDHGTYVEHRSSAPRRSAGGSG